MISQVFQMPAACDIADVKSVVQLHLNPLQHVLIVFIATVILYLSSSSFGGREWGHRSVLLQSPREKITWSQVRWTILTARCLHH